MKQLANAEAHIDALLAWYARARRDFPWRREPRPYLVWLAEIMSQQTTMAALLPYFHRFLERFPDVAALAAATEDEVLKAWAGLGYYSRARNLHRAARAIVAENGGKFPETYGGWLSLPGVGPYTAAAVASQCFGVAEPVWDGNVLRVCARLAARGDAHGAAFKTEALEALRALLRGHDASDFNQALMELGATVCTPKNPTCGRCPLSKGCAALAAGASSSYPPPKPRKQTIDVRCRVHVRLRRTPGGLETYLLPRETGQWFAGLWDFPSELGGVRRPRAKIDGLPSGARPLGQARHQITHHRITLVGLVEATGPMGLTQERKSGPGRWLKLDELYEERPPVPLSTTARKVLRLVAKQQIS